jgi:hypothetical protein
MLQWHRKSSSECNVQGRHQTLQSTYMCDMFDGRLNGCQPYTIPDSVLTPMALRRLKLHTIYEYKVTRIAIPGTQRKILVVHGMTGNASTACLHNAQIVCNMTPASRSTIIDIAIRMIITLHPESVRSRS